MPSSADRPKGPADYIEQADQAREQGELELAGLLLHRAELALATAPPEPQPVPPGSVDLGVLWQALQEVDVVVWRDQVDAAEQVGEDAFKIRLPAATADAITGAIKAKLDG